MKKFCIMVLSVVIAAALYIWGCGLIDKATTREPDIIGTISEQPPFTNTVCSW